MKTKKIVSASLMSLGMVVGLAGYAGAQMGSIDTTGPDSVNVVKEKTSSRVRVKNTNNLSASNVNDQSSRTGKAGVYHNTTGGDARTGAASNANSLSISATVDNSASSAAKLAPAPANNNSATIENTGPDSKNIVKISNESSFRVTNENNVSVSNTNSQTATSGKATVAGNTTGGDAVSGNASNTSATTMTFKISN